ncbi:hypothetical protein [Nostoc sp. DedQUE09]|nr:hypothetical protein [Nostoc sp. DedQUE09]MDZ7951561.1 hypothetical protein [Nostoc sp. DedQUE09]
MQLSILFVLSVIAGRLTPQYNGQAIALSQTLEYYSQSCRDDWR